MSKFGGGITILGKRENALQVITETGKVLYKINTAQEAAQTTVLGSMHAEKVHGLREQLKIISFDDLAEHTEDSFRYNVTPAQSGTTFILNIEHMDFRKNLTIFLPDKMEGATYKFEILRLVYHVSSPASVMFQVNKASHTYENGRIFFGLQRYQSSSSRETSGETSGGCKTPGTCFLPEMTGACSEDGNTSSTQFHSRYNAGAGSNIEFTFLGASNNSPEYMYFGETFVASAAGISCFI